MVPDGEGFFTAFRMTTSSRTPTDSPSFLPLLVLFVLLVVNALDLPSADIRHCRRHNRHKLDVGIERETCHMHDRIGHVLCIHLGFRPDLSVRLRHPG